MMHLVSIQSVSMMNQINIAYDQLLLHSVVQDFPSTVTRVGTLYAWGDAIYQFTETGWVKMIKLQPGEGIEVMRSMQGK